MTEMEDESFFDISAPQPSRNLSSSPWMTQNESNVQRQQQKINNMSTINDGQNVYFPVSSAPNYEASNEQADNIDTWDPMGDDFACPTFNCYKNFDVLNAERPSEKSPEKSIRQSPEKRVEEISLYVGNIPLSITNEGVRNLFLTVGEVQSYKILPPKDPSNDTKYGFVKYCSWREAIKAIETFDGFYVGSEKNLQVRVAHKRRGGDDYFAVRDEDYSSSDGTAQDTPTNRHPPFNDSYNFDEATSDQNLSMSQDRPAEVNHSQERPTEVNYINSDQHLNMSPAINLGHSEQTVSEKLPNEASHASPATPRAKLPCTRCEKLCTQRCSACKTPYCSRECQKIDKARHKLMCTYQGNTNTPKPANSSTPAPIPAQVPEPEPDNDSDFDCIDISLDTTQSPRKEIAKDEIKNSIQSSKGNIALDSGYTSQKEDMGIAIPSESRRGEVNTDTGMVIPEDEILHSDMPGAQTWLEKKFSAYVTAVSFVNSFWAVVRTPDYPRFCELTAEMAEITEENLEKITVVNLGSLCLARFSLDNCWYRSRIMQGNTEQVEVIFVDYGNKEWKNIHDLYQLPPGFGDVPPQAHQFSLHGVTLESYSEIEQRMVKLLDTMVSGKTLQVELVYSAPGCIPEVILRENDAQESINQQMINYLEQETSNVISSRGLPYQSYVGKNMGMDSRKPSETQPVRETFQQGLLSESHYPMTSYATVNAAVNYPAGSYLSDSVPGSDPIASYGSHSVSGNVPMTNEVVTAYESYNVPPNDPMIGNLSDNTPDCNPVTGRLSDNVPENNLVTDDLSGTISYDNGPTANYASGNIPPNHSMTSFTTSDPMTSYVSSQVSPIPNTVLKTHMASGVPNDILPSTETFDIFVCHFLTPTSFWIWFLDSAKEIYIQLASMLSETYEQSTYSEYLPIAGELIAAKFTDGVWYRAKLDCINNDCTLKVTFIDFGNSEDVSLYDTRKITDALAAIPKLATKCALYGMEKPIRNWSAECIQFCNELMLNKRGSAIFQGQVQDSLVMRVDVEINGEMKSVVDEIVKQGYLISEKLQIQDSGVVPANTPTEQTPMNKESATFHYQPFVSDNKRVLPSNEPVLPDNKPVFPSSQPVIASSQPVSPSYKPDFPHDMKPPLPHHQTTLQVNKPALLSNQPVCPDKHARPEDNPVSSDNKPATFGNRPITKPALPTSQPVSRYNKPVFPDMKPPLPCGQSSLPDNKPVLPEGKPVKFSNQPVYPNRNPAFKPVISDSSPVLPTSQPVSSSCNPVLLHNKPDALLKQPVYPGNKMASPASNSSMQLISPNVQPVSAECKTNEVNNVESQPKPNTSLQSAATSPQLSQISPNSVPTGQKMEPKYKTMLPLPTVPITAFNVIVNDVVSTDTFYAQMTGPSLVSQLHKCVRELNEYVTKKHPPKVENAAVGTLGCAKFSQDNVWYRAQVDKITDGNYKVRFIDFGNIQDVSPDEFLEAPEFFYQLAPQAICCRLGTSDHVWGEQSRNMMKVLTLNKQLSCTVIGGTSWPQYAVKLQRTVGHQVMDIAEELNKGMTSRRPEWTSPCPSNTPSPRASSTPSPRSSRSKRQSSTFSEKVLNPAIFTSGIGEMGEKYEVSISNIFHPTYFWVQHAENVETIERLHDELNSHYNNNSYPPFKPLENSFCVYLHRSHWYRVFVRHTTSRGLILHSVDFGYQLLADEKFLRPVEGKFCSQPFGAILCSMADVEPYDRKLWTDAATKYFRSKVKSKVVTIRVTFNSKARLFVQVFDPDSSDECLLKTALIANGMAKEFQRKSTQSESISCIDQMLDVPNMPTAELSLGDDSNIGRQISSQDQSGEDYSLPNQSSAHSVHKDKANRTDGNKAQGYISNVRSRPES